MPTYQTLVDDSFQRASTAYSSGATSGNWTQWGNNNWRGNDARFFKLNGGKATFITAQTVEVYRTEVVTINSKISWVCDPTDAFWYISSRAAGAASTRDWAGIRFRVLAAAVVTDGWHSTGGSKTQTSMSASGVATIPYVAGHSYRFNVTTTGTTTLTIVATIDDITAGTSSLALTITYTAPAATIQVAAGCCVTVTGGATDAQGTRATTYYDCVDTLSSSPANVAPVLSNTALAMTCTSALGTLTLQLINSSTATIFSQSSTGGTTTTLTIVPGSTTSAVVIQDSVTGSAFYLNIAPVSISATPNSFGVGLSGQATTIAGQGTAWGAGTTPLVVLSGPITITSQTQTDLGSINLVITTGASAGTGVIQDTTTGAKVNIGVTQPFAADAMNDYASEGNWTTVAGTSIQTNNAGAYRRVRIANGSTIAVTFDMSTYTMAGLTQYPTVYYYVDDGTPTALTLNASSGAAPTVLFSGLDPTQAFHDLFIMADALPTGFGYNRWTNPIPILRITGWVTDGTPVAPPTRPGRMLVLGDSITQGNILGAVIANTSTGSANQSYVLPLADALNCEFCTVGFSGQGWVIGGADGVPAFHNTGGIQSWDKIDSAHARSFALSSGNGYYDYILVNQGTNDDINAIADATITARALDFLPKIRTSAGSKSKICLLVPFGQRKQAALQAAYASTKTLGTIGNTILIDPKTITGVGPAAVAPYGTPSYRSADSTHPRVAPQVAYMVGTLALAMAGGSTLSSYTAITLTPAQFDVDLANKPSDAISSSLSGNIYINDESNAEQIVPITAGIQTIVRANQIKSKGLPIGSIQITVFKTEA